MTALSNQGGRRPDAGLSCIESGFALGVGGDDAVDAGRDRTGPVRRIPAAAPRPAAA